MTARRFIRDVLFANLPIPFYNLRTYVLMVVFTHAMGTAGFGIWALFSSSLGIILNIASVCQGNAMMRFAAGEKTSTELGVLWSTALVIVAGAGAICVTILLLLGGPAASALFDAPRAERLVTYLAGAIAFDVFYEQARSYLRARRQNFVWAAVTITRLSVEAIALIVAALTKRVEIVLATYVGMSLVSAVAGQTVTWVVTRPQIVVPSRPALKRSFLFGITILPGSFAYMLAATGSRYLVGVRADVTAVGIYSVILTLSALIYFYVGPITDVLLPELADLHDRSNNETLIERFRGTQKLVLGVSGSAAAVFVAAPVSVLRVVSPPEFAVGATALAIMGVQGLLMSIMLLYVVVLTVRLKVLQGTLIWSLLAVVSLSIAWVLIPRVGVAGAAMGQLVGTLACCGLLLWVSRDLVRSSFDPRWGVQVSGAMLLAYLAGRLWTGPPQGPLEALVRMTTCGLVYVACLWLVGYVKVDELKLLKSALVR